MRLPRVGKGPLTSLELAEAAVLGDLAALLVMVAWFFPFPVAPVIQAAAATPFAILAMRHRLRAVIVSTIAASAVAGLAFGPGPAGAMSGIAAVGWVVGVGMRRGWTLPAIVAFGLVMVWAPASALVDGALFALPALRNLAVDQLDVGWRGLRNTLLRGVQPEFLAQMDLAIDWYKTHWFMVFPIVGAIVIIVAIVAARLLAGGALSRVRSSLAAPARPRAQEHGKPGPVPVELDRVSFRYPSATRDALSNVSLGIPEAVFVAVLGPNGSGKSTLARVLAGAPATAGVVRRPGTAALGRAGGTAVVFQRPETQVIGVRVRDDVVWGLADATSVDVGGLLRTVGLEGFEDRETATLSGGELQRLAVAAALARRPQLLVSDESTAMLDPRGRDRLMALLRTLPREQGVTVVHVTHRHVEADGADIVLVLDAGVVNRRVMTA